MNRKTVSLCLIARDEESSIGMALKSILALVDEVIVVDTGSRDNTRIIAEGYGARVLDLAWEDDFSLARNQALSEAVCDWILVLDADEFLQPVRPVEFQRLLNDPAAAGYRLRMASPQGPEGRPQASMIRLFRNQPEIRYQHPIFEDVSESLNWYAQREGLRILDADLTIVHEGGKPNHEAGKRERNRRILNKAMINYPREAFFPFQMGLAGLQTLDDEVLPCAGLNQSLGFFHRAWALLESQDPEYLQGLAWLPDLGVKSSSGLLADGQLHEARALIRKVGEIFPSHPRVQLQWAVVDLRFLEEGSAERAPEISFQLREQTGRRLEKLLAGPGTGNRVARDRRIWELYPWRYLGELALLAGKVSEAVGYFEQALSLDPEYSFGWLGMAECSRFAGDRKRALKLYLRAVTESQWNHRGWLRGSDLMQEMGFHDNATTWRHKLGSLFPEHPALRRDNSRGLQPIG